METLIELYDDRPFENVLSTEVFRPGRTVFICPPEVSKNTSLQKKLEEFFRRRGIDSELTFTEANMFSAADVLNKLRGAVKKYPGCAIDITGGTDSSLFASGLLCSGSDIPVFTFSRKRNMFFDIVNAPFAEKRVCDIQYKVEDFFLMAGGSVRTGRVDNAKLSAYLDIIDPFFALYLKYKSAWNSIISYIQEISPTPQNGAPVSLQANGGYAVKVKRGSNLTVNADALRDFERIGMIRSLKIKDNERVSFVFRDELCRFWLRDVGSVLELYIYKACFEAGRFQDVRTSVIVDWEGTNGRDGVTNELDVMASCGVLPVFISCKTCEIKTEALNELAILRDRFGGQGARAAIVTTTTGRGAMRNRAAELDIDVIDLNDLKNGSFRQHIASLAKSR